MLQRYMRDYHARRLASAIEYRVRLPGNVNLDEFREMTALYRSPNAVSFESDYIIGILRRIGQGMLPQTFGIGGLSPSAVIAFVDDVAERDPRLLHGADMIPEVHEERGIRRKFFEPDRDLGFELIASTHVELGLLERNWSGAPN
jgi:hypothetical protein